MKNTVITGSSRGIGKAVAEETVRKNNREAMRTQAAFVEVIREREESACR